MAFFIFGHCFRDVARKFTYNMLGDCLGFLLIFIFILFLAFIFGRYLAKLFKGQKTFLDVLKPIERFIFRLCKIDPERPMDWKNYLLALLTIQVCWFIPAIVLLIIQQQLILNPNHIQNMNWDLAFNTAVSFLTSTNLQHYSGETGASYFTQIFVFTFLQFVSAATSLAVGVAVVRGLRKENGKGLGNFFSDFLLSITRVLLPLSCLVAVLFVLNGVPMNFNANDQIQTLQGTQMEVAKGPVAAMISIKEIGSNGGGFFGANDAHPFENPNFFTMIIHFIIVLLLPMSFVFFIGNYLANKKFAWMLFGVMSMGMFLLTIPILKDESRGNPKILAMSIDSKLGNMEGKETRFGSNYSALYCAENIVVPAGTSISVHDSFMPLSDMAMISGMQIDAFFGGLGTGWLNMFIYLIIAVFVATLMIGRTPEFFGRKIGINEMKIAVSVNILQILIPITFTAISCFIYENQNQNILNWLSNKGAHGFTTMFYEYISSMAGNGSNFAGLSNNTPYWNLTTSFVMLCGRFIPIVGVIGITGLIRNKKYIHPSSGTLKTDSITFGVFLLSIIFVLTLLSLFLSLIIGPITEYFYLHQPNI